MPPPCHLPALSPCSPCAEHAAGGTARPPPAPQHPRVPQGPRVPPTSTDRRGLARCWAEGSAGSGSAKDALLLMGSGRGAPAGTGWALGLRFFLLSSILEGLPELRGRHPRRMDARLLAAPCWGLLRPHAPSKALGGSWWVVARLGGLQRGSRSCGGARWVRQQQEGRGQELCPHSLGSAAGLGLRYLGLCRSIRAQGRGWDLKSSQGAPSRGLLPSVISQSPSRKEKRISAPAGQGETPDALRESWS